MVRVRSTPRTARTDGSQGHVIVQISNFKPPQEGSERGGGEGVSSTQTDTVWNPASCWGLVRYEEPKRRRQYTAHRQVFSGWIEITIGFKSNMIAICLPTRRRRHIRSAVRPEPDKNSDPTRSDLRPDPTPNPHHPSRPQSSRRADVLYVPPLAGWLATSAPTAWQGDNEDGNGKARYGTGRMKDPAIPHAPESFDAEQCGLTLHGVYTDKDLPHTENRYL